MKTSERTLILVLITLFVLTCIGCENNNDDVKAKCYDNYLLTDKCLKELDNG